MHVLYLNYFYDKDIPAPEKLLARYYTMTNWCAAVKNAGTEKVSVVQRFSHSKNFVSKGVEFHFVKDEFGPKLKPWQTPQLLHRHVKELAPDVIHSNGWPLPLISLRTLLQDRTAILWQDHGGNVPFFAYQWLYKAGFKVVDGFIFTTERQAVAWKMHKLIPSEAYVYEVLEGSTDFEPLDYHTSRQRLNINGQPTFLWVGRLNSNKDPITVIKGFALASARFHDPRLYMVYSDDQLLDHVKQTIIRLRLREKVHLVGPVPYSTLAQYYSACDYFLLGSHSEGSGYALLEALACGVTPIVTDIAPFRRITENGKLGALWRPGDGSSLVQAIYAIQQRKVQRDIVRSFFLKHWSFEAIGRAALNVYHKAYERKIM